MEKFEQLINGYNTYLESDEEIIPKIKEPDGVYFYVPPLEYSNVIYAMYEIYVRKNFAISKQLFYRAALIPQFMSEKFDRRVLDSGMYQISYALLSDNRDIIKSYSILKNKINHETGIGYQVPNAVQNILLEDRDKLDWNIHCIGRLIKHPKLMHLEGYLDAFVGFKNHDQALIEQGLKKLIAKPKKLDDHPLIPRFFSRDAAGLNKLAWMRGMEIDLKSSLVPVELMPVQPLEKYEGYDFLDELWDKPLSIPER
ncbi:Imm49 family immunity protein [Mucilaginibacter defluvii]|uniref:Immunity protein 49 of polymorphic toxin system n=1 Tax=Mucilaginibacter defluvii TaxID=1196019 RepID=A0ABP9G593_9SPHI